MTFKEKFINFFKKIGYGLKVAAIATGHFFVKLHHCKLFTLTRMQLKDKVDLSWVKTFKKWPQKIIFSIVKFALVFGITFLILLLAVKLGIFYQSETIRLANLMITVMLVLSIISCTVGLMNTLYFDEDNKVLVTLPVNGGTLFFSKLIVFYIDELKKAVFFTIPVLYACMFAAKNYVSVASYFWMVIPMLFYVAIPVLIGALLSIPAIFIKRLFIKAPAVEIIFYLILLGLGVWGVIELINLIPDSINLLEEGETYKKLLRDAMIFAESKLTLIYQFTKMIIGDSVPPALNFTLGVKVLYRLGIMIAGIVVLVGLAFLITYPFFFYMMTKNFEFNKKVFKNEKVNHVYPVWLTFLLKELKLQIRDIKNNMGMIITYVAVPILIYLLNKIFFAMEINTTGKWYSYFFNFLLVGLPIFASNTQIASIYSIEGRAAYIKRTKPVSLYWALTCKLLLFIVGSFISIGVCFGIIDNFTELDTGTCTMICIGMMGVQLALIYFAAIQDIIHPQNEHFATVGNTNGSKNEAVATIVEFLVAVIFAGGAFFLMKEAYGLDNYTYTRASVELMCIGIIAAAIAVVMFILNVRGFYYDNERK